MRAGRLGVKFKRQVPVGRYIPDFVCFEKRLVVEVDGASHTDTRKDRRRDRWFIGQGWFVLRFSGDELDADLPHVLDTIRLAMEDPSQVSNPLNIYWRGTT